MIRVCEIRTQIKPCPLIFGLFFQSAYERRNEFQLNDSAAYFLDDVERFLAKSYEVCNAITEIPFWIHL